MSDEFVALKYASLSLQVGAPGQFYWLLNASVKVKNVAYSKDVQLHYRDPSSGIWQDRPLAWKANYGDYDLFALEPALNFGSYSSVEFVIRYMSSGATNWDNNNFTNYSLSPSASGLTSTGARTSGNNVMLNSANVVYGGVAGSVYVTGIQGEIFVNNLSYHKRVGIRYSNDGWVTQLDIDAVYDHSLGGFLESWRFGRNTTPAGFGRGEFAIYYQNRETGQYYWDNNFDQNYDITYRYSLD